jgi:WD40 repeat protein
MRQVSKPLLVFAYMGLIFLSFRNEFPTTTISILKDHADEVWHVTYSHSGRYLASASKDGSCIIWDMKVRKRVVCLRLTDCLCRIRHICV